MHRGTGPGRGAAALESAARAVWRQTQPSWPSRANRDSSELQRIEQQREQLQSSFNEINRTLSGIASALSGKRTRAEHINQRREQLHREQQEILQQIETDREELELTLATAAQCAGVDRDPGQPPRVTGGRARRVARGADPAA